MAPNTNGKLPYELVRDVFTQPSLESGSLEPVEIIRARTHLSPLWSTTRIQSAITQGGVNVESDEDYALSDEWSEAETIEELEGRDIRCTGSSYM